MRKQLFLDIRNCLETIKDNEGNNVFQHFDLWNQNVEFLEQNSPFQVPAVFIEFVPIQWQSQGLNKQNAELYIRVHIVTKWHAQTAAYTPTDIQLRELDYLNLANHVAYALMNFAPASGNRMIRTNSEINHNHTSYIDSVEVFKCGIVDPTATTILELTPVDATPIINIEPAE